MLTHMALGGRPRGRYKERETIWNKNEERIVYALMDKYPNSVRIKYLEEKTELTRRTLYKHLKNLQEKGIIKRDEASIIRLNSVKFLESKQEIPLDPDKDIKCDLNPGPYILVLRAEADNKSKYEITTRGNIVFSGGESRDIASTIPLYLNVPDLNVKFKAMEGPCKLRWYQLAVFPKT